MMMFYWVSLFIVSISFADRVVALDAIGVTLVSIVALLSLIIETEFFLEVILLMSILSFIGTAAFAKFLERGEIFDRDLR